MNIEDRLESIDTSLKTLVTILQSAGTITAVAGAPEVAAAAPAADKPKTTRKAKDEPQKLRNFRVQSRAVEL